MRSFFDSQVEGKSNISHLQNFQFLKDICILQIWSKEDTLNNCPKILWYRKIRACGNEVENRKVITPNRTALPGKQNAISKSKMLLQTG
jgi:hypothetical protein